ncbi:MAG: hypothetical protein U0871_18545 [Gemmataceae bacterium]
MRLTGWALVAIGTVLFLSAGANYLVFDVAQVEQAGTVNSAGRPAGMYWLALIPAAAERYPRRAVDGDDRRQGVSGDLRHGQAARSRQPGPAAGGTGAGRVGRRG